MSVCSCRGGFDMTITHDALDTIPPPPHHGHVPKWTGTPPRLVLPPFYLHMIAITGDVLKLVQESRSPKMLVYFCLCIQSLQHNYKGFLKSHLALLGKDIPGSIPDEGSLHLMKHYCFPLCKPFLLTLLTLCNYGKTRMS